MSSKSTAAAHSGTIFLSSLLDEERLPFQDPELIFGRAHYSWKLINQLYENGLEMAGYTARNLARPEIYQAPAAQEVMGLTSHDLHIAVKPIEHLRPFYGLPNLFVCGWEFPELFRGTPDLSPFFDQQAVLGRADSILCWTDFTRDNLHAAGLSQAVTLPPPVYPTVPGDETKVMAMPALFLASDDISELPDVTSFGAAIEGRTEPVLLAVLNPFDKRKRIDKLLEGARLAREAGYDFLLVVKLVVDGKATTIRNISEILHSMYSYHETSESVLFCAGHLDDASMAALRARSDFHIGAPSAEGLNLPLVESALQDIPIITTHNTAMASYLGAQDAIWIDCSAEAADQSVNAFADYANFTHFPAAPDAICTAICAALSLDEDARKALAQRGRKAVEARFGQARFETDFNALIQDVLV